MTEYLTTWRDLFAKMNIIDVETREALKAGDKAGTFAYCMHIFAGEFGVNATCSALEFYRMLSEEEKFLIVSSHLLPLRPLWTHEQTFNFDKETPWEDVLRSKAEWVIPHKHALHQKTMMMQAIYQIRYTKCHEVFVMMLHWFPPQAAEHIARYWFDDRGWTRTIVKLEMS